MSLADGRLPPATIPHTLRPISPDNYLFLQQWIHRESGIVIEMDKSYLLHSRLAPVLEREKLATIEKLCGTLKSGAPSIARQVVEAMTTNETLFFRDQTPFDALRNQILPKLIAARINGQRLAIWSAAASSGQEAYSLAMLLLEMGINPCDIEIFGSDLSDDVLAKARLGIYGKFEVNRGMLPGYLDRYFDPLGARWQVKSYIRKMVRFQQLDLRSSLSSIGLFDVVLCRNVLIYFDMETKLSVLRRMRATLPVGGYLMLGAAETIGSMVPTLQREIVGQAVAYVAV